MVDDILKKSALGRTDLELMIKKTLVSCIWRLY